MANLSGFRYQRIFTKIWTDDKFLALKSDDSRYLFLYLLSSPHSNMIGLYKLPLKYIQADLNWELKRFTEPFAELLRERFIQYDEKTSVLMICNHLKHNPIENQNQVTAAVRIIENLPESSIILDTLEPLGKPFHKPLVELLRERLGKPVNSNQLEVRSKKKEEKELKPFSSDSIEVRLSELLLSLIKQRNPNHKQPDIQAWAKVITLMIRIDKRPPDEIERVIQWCQADSFWKDNILSTGKLREKYDQLFLKMSQTKPNMEVDDNGRFERAMALRRDKKT